MKSINIRVAMLGVCLFLAPAVWAQSPDSENQSAASPALSVSPAEVPRLIKFSGTLLDAQEQPLAGPVGVTFALHAQQTGGAALWLETQNVSPDGNGNYTVLLGANSAKGVPAELFVSGEARWLGIQVGQQAEHERILLVSVPYALKAGDAQTLGGKPASAFLTTETLASAGNSAAAATATAASSTPGALPKSSTATTAKKAASTPQVACTSVTSGGAAPLNSIAKFTGSCSVDGSAITETGGNVGIGTTTPAAALHVNGNTLLVTSATTAQLQFSGSASSARFGQDLNGAFFASDSPGKAVRFYTNNGTLNEGLRVTSAGNVGIGTPTPAATLDVAGTGNFTGNTTTSNTAIVGATQSGSSSTLFNFTPATVPPVALGGLATATSGTVVGVGGISISPAGAGMGAINFSTAGGAGMVAFSAGAADKSSAIEAFQGGTSFATRGVHVDILSPSGVSGLFDNSASGDLLIGRSGPSGSKVDEFHVYGNGNVTILGNFHSATAGDGIILKSPNGLVCKLLGIDNTGATTLTTVTCPAAP